MISPRRKAVYLVLNGFTIIGALLSSGCGSQNTLRVAESIALEIPDARTLASATGDGFWLGLPGRLVRLDSKGETTATIPLPRGGVPELLQDAEAGRLLRTPEALILLTSDSTRTLEVDPSSVAVAADGWVLSSDADGSIVGYSFQDLVPRWGWSGMGGATTALAIAPEGLHVYQAVQTAADDSESFLLVRDLLSGRVLRNVPLSGALRLLTVGSDGTIFGASWGSADEANVSGFAWHDGEVVLVWSESVDIGDASELRMSVSPVEDGLAVVAVNDEAGLTLLDGRTGSSVGRMRTPAFDAAFDPEGKLYLLTGDGILSLE